ncbi:MAG: MBL fold metallo-hydrolase, partial [Gemmatimonadales bacterium]
MIRASRQATSMLAVHLAVFATVFSGCIGAQGERAEQSKGVEITFFDVGQADAILVRSPEGRTALIDAGRSEDVVDLLRSSSVDSLDVAIASHGHADHIGGMEAVIRQLPVRYYVDNGVPHTTATYLRLQRALVDSDVQYLRPEARSIRLGTVALQILPPPGDVDEGQNHNSVGVIVTFGRFRALLTGDSEVEELNHFLTLGVPNVTVLKAAHHGARDAVTPAWLAATKPEVVVISCGPDNPYGHPDEWAL